MLTWTRQTHPINFFSVSRNEDAKKNGKRENKSNVVLSEITGLRWAAFAFVKMQYNYVCLLRSKITHQQYLISAVNRALAEWILYVKVFDHFSFFWWKRLKMMSFHFRENYSLNVPRKHAENERRDKSVKNAIFQSNCTKLRNHFEGIVHFDIKGIVFIEIQTLHRRIWLFL